MNDGHTTTPVSHADLLARLQRMALAASSRYDLSPRSTATLVNLSENATYRIDDPDSGGKAILRIHRVGYHSYAAINSELQWMAALRRDAGLETPEAIPARDGTVIQTLLSPELRDPRHAVMSKFMTGHEPPEDELVAPFERLGEVSARMHEHAKRWPLPPGFTRHTWDYETALGSRPIWGRWQDGMGMNPAREAVLGRMSEAIRRRLERYGKPRERFGLTHADIRLANLLIEGTRTKVIDFDDCGFSWYLYDLGTALSFIEHRPDVPALVDAWLSGYHKVVTLSAEERAEIPTFIMLRRLLLVAWIGSHAETDLAQSLGEPYTEGSCQLAETYLSKFG
ncbi:MAG TPA: phosphotransferase [Methylomirabilota bacterium]|nr:phosphotransferase [Methylomirabilota bacterium]